MAHNYKKFDFENGDIPVPGMWNENMNNFSSEMNGLLDRDNLPRDAVGTAQTSFANTDGSFAYVQFSSYTGAGTFQTDFKGWQTIPIAIPDLLGVGDEMLAVEASIQVNASWTPASTAIDNLISFQILVDGIAVCESGPMSLIYTAFCVPLDGVVAITSGSRTVELKARYQVPGGIAATHPTITVTPVEVVWTRWRR
jgi:hypothetical protein